MFNVENPTTGSNYYGKRPCGLFKKSSNGPRSAPEVKVDDPPPQRFKAVSSALQVPTKDPIFQIGNHSASYSAVVGDGDASYSAVVGVGAPDGDPISSSATQCFEFEAISSAIQVPRENPAFHIRENLSDLFRIYVDKEEHACINSSKEAWLEQISLCEAIPSQQALPPWTSHQIQGREDFDEAPRLPSCGYIPCGEDGLLPQLSEWLPHVNQVAKMDYCH